MQLFLQPFWELQDKSLDWVGDNRVPAFVVTSQITETSVPTHILIDKIQRTKLILFCFYCHCLLGLGEWY